MTKEEKIQLKKKLPPKWSVTIAESTGWSQAYVRRVMYGMASHIGIEKAALLLAQQHQKELMANELLKKQVL
ncbi:MAG: hypothetical protein LBU37_05925 [Tannerellaceae bacterium]|jgi:hypothetical protein|nr:hypothetical protein [Tannerellaceae bacterium]